MACSHLCQAVDELSLGSPKEVPATQSPPHSRHLRKMTAYSFCLEYRILSISSYKCFLYTFFRKIWQVDLEFGFDEKICHTSGKQIKKIIEKQQIAIH